MCAVDEQGKARQHHLRISPAERKQEKENEGDKDKRKAEMERTGRETWTERGKRKGAIRY